MKMAESWICNPKGSGIYADFYPVRKSGMLFTGNGSGGRTNINADSDTVHMHYFCHCYH